MKSLILRFGTLFLLALSSFAQNPKEHEDQPTRLIDSLKGQQLFLWTASERPILLGFNPVIKYLFLDTNYLDDC